MRLVKNFFFSVLFIFLSFLIGLIICESILRVKHSLIINYDIEMWKYAKQLKQKDIDPKIGHTHIKDKSSYLQKVNIKINNYGQRDIDYNNNTLSKHDRSFLILGSSITLGWGVSKDDMFSNVLNKMSKLDNKNWIFINGGVGNYNTERYVNNYFKNWKELEFTDIIIHFFVNDTEVIEDSEVNFFTKNTHLGVVVWKLINSYKSSFKKEKLNDYYEEKYNDNYRGFQVAKKELKKLKKYCDINNINCHLVLMPDIHQLEPYNLFFINEKISFFSKEINMPYHDLLGSFVSLEKNIIWNKYQDPHPNVYGHKIIAEEIYNFLSK